MELDFGITKGSCHVIQDEHVSGLFKIFCENSENLRGNSPSPAGADLFRRDAGGLLNDSKKELFHTCTKKCIFIAKRACTDVVLPVSVLCGRVRNPTKDDWKKLKLLIDYLKATKELNLDLSLDGCIPVMKCYVDEIFAVHEDFKAHT